MNYRMSIKGDGQILNSSGNPLNGVEKERLCRQFNELQAENRRLRTALETMLESFTSHFPHGAEVTAARAALDLTPIT